MHDAATSMPQAPSTWADYLAGYRWRGQGEGCSAATVHRLEAERRPTLFVKQEVLSAHAELPAEIARLRWLHGAGIDCPQVLNETQSDGRQWLLMSAVPGTRCPRWRSAASWSPSAWCAWWPPPCAGCTISIRPPALRPSPGTAPGHRAPAGRGRAGGRGGLRRRPSRSQRHGAVPPAARPASGGRRPDGRPWRRLPAKSAGGGRRFSGFIDCGRLGVADRHQDLALAARDIEAELGAAWAEAFLVEYGGDIDGERLAYFRLLDEFF